jgi:hypothetical protein
VKKSFRATIFRALGLVNLIKIQILGMGDILTFTQLYNSLLVLPFLVLAIYLSKKYIFY